MTVNEPLREKVIHAMSGDKELADTSWNDFKNFLVRVTDKQFADAYMAGWVAGYGAAFSHKHDGPIPVPAVDEDAEMEAKLKEMGIDVQKMRETPVPSGMFQ
jgi:hypothetical protein